MIEQITILAQRWEIEQFIEFGRRCEDFHRMMMMMITAWHRDRWAWTDWFRRRLLMLEFIRQGQPTVGNVRNTFEIILHR